MKPRKQLEVDLAWLRACVDFTPQEKILIAGVLAVALVGLIARWWILSQSQGARPIATATKQLEEVNP